MGNGSTRRQREDSKSKKEPYACSLPFWGNICKNKHPSKTTKPVPKSGISPPSPLPTSSAKNRFTKETMSTYGKVILYQFSQSPVMSYPNS